MRKSILYYLFGFGRLPKAVRPIFKTEGIIIAEEGLKGTATLRKFRAPGRFHSYKKSVFVGSLVITELRFAAFAFSRPIINVPIYDERIKQLDLTMPKAGVLCVKFEAGAFHEGWKGSVECRFTTPKANTVLKKLHSNEG